jgi:hypothetical protein
LTANTISTISIPYDSSIGAGNDYTHSMNLDEIVTGGDDSCPTYCTLMQATTGDTGSLDDPWKLANVGVVIDSDNTCDRNWYLAFITG